MPDETVDESTPVPQVREAYNRAQARAAELEPLASRVPQLERENALLRAGGDPDSRVGRLLLSDDTVDWTEREAVAAAWTEVSPTAPPAATPSPAETERPDPEAIARQERREALNNGHTAPGSEPSPHPWDEAHQVFRDGRDRHLNRERAAAPAYDTILQAAVDGDARVIYDPRRPYSEQYDPR